MSTDSSEEIYRTLTPSLNFEDTAAAMDFYAKAFGAIPRFKIDMPQGGVMHAEMQLGDSVFFLSDAAPDFHAPTPAQVGACPTLMALRFDNADDIFNQAVAAGAEVLMPMQDWFWGERMGTIKDPFGYRWSLGKHIEDVPPDEVMRRARELMPGG